SSQDDRVRNTAPPPLEQEPSKHTETNRFVQLRRMNMQRRRWQPLRECHAPGKISRPTVVVANEETADSPDQVSECQRRRRGSEGRYYRPSAQDDVGESGTDAAKKSSVPTQAPARQQQIHRRRLGCVLDGPQQLGASEAADHADNPGV